MLNKFRCKKCQAIFYVGMEEIDPKEPVKHCVCCGSSELEFLSIGGSRPKLGQESIRDVFAVGQNVLVRFGIDWRTREILGITVLRHDANCPHCDMALLGEPRFWFTDYGNVSLDEIIAKEDIDPNRIRPPNTLVSQTKGS